MVKNSVNRRISHELDSKISAYRKMLERRHGMRYSYIQASQAIAKEISR